MCNKVVVIDLNEKLPEQFADKPNRSQSSCGLFDSRTRQLAKTFDLKFAVK